MTKYLSTPTNAVLVAIDMSKHRQEVLIERPEGGRRRRMTVMATKDDYDRLVEELASMARPIVVGFEATGNYHRTLAHKLLVAGFPVATDLFSCIDQNARGTAQRLGQERSEGCTGDAAHAADRCHPGLRRSA